MNDSALGVRYFVQLRHRIKLHEVIWISFIWISLVHVVSSAHLFCIKNNGKKQLVFSFLATSKENYDQQTRI